MKNTKTGQNDINAPKYFNKKLVLEAYARFNMQFYIDIHAHKVSIAITS